MAPDHAAREQHRAAGAVALLEDDRRSAELARARRGDEAGHAGAGDEQLAQVSENDGLCSTYSSFTPVRAPDEDRERVRRVDDVLDLDAELLGLGLVLVGRVDEHAEVVEQRPLRLARVALRQLEEGAADLQPPVAGRREAELLPAARGGLGIAGAERDVVEVELGVGLRFDEDDLEPFAEVDQRRRGRRARRRAARPARARRARAAPGVEQRQLAPPGVGAEQREPVGLLDHAHPEPRDRGRRDRSRSATQSAT